MGTVEDHRPPARPARPAEEVLATLMRSYESIELDLAALKDKLKNKEGSAGS